MSHEEEGNMIIVGLIVIPIVFALGAIIVELII